MQIHNLQQGTPEWHEHRAIYRNASHAPAVMGVSPYQTRTELLHQCSTGISPDIDDATQRRFDDGHRFEGLARALAEEIVGEDLYPVVGSDGKYSASFDGIAMGEDFIFEHKSINDAIRAVASAKELPEYLRVQMEHQLMVSGAGRCLFMASKWDNEGSLLEEKHFWYEPDLDLRARIIAGWDQFEKDLAAYVPFEIVEKPQANAIMQLPALAVQIRGEVLTSNLPAFTSAAERFLANIKTELETDEDFSNAEETVKFCDRAEKDLELAKKSAIAQTTSIDELLRTIDYVKDELRAKRLLLTNLVKTQKEAIKGRILADARLKFADHLAAIESEIKPIRLVYQQPDFQGSIKNKRTLASLHDAVDSTLANAKIATDAIAKDVRAKLAWYKENAVGHEMLFADLDRIIYKPSDDFQMLVKNRIDQHQAEEKVRIERLAEQLALAAQAVVSQPAPVSVAAQAPSTETPKPATGKSGGSLVSRNVPPRVDPLMVALARRDAEAFRIKFARIGELAQVHAAIDSFLAATAPQITRETVEV